MTFYLCDCRNRTEPRAKTTTPIHSSVSSYPVSNIAYRLFLLGLVPIIAAILDSGEAEKAAQAPWFSYDAWHLHTGRIPVFEATQVPITSGFTGTFPSTGGPSPKTFAQAKSLSITVPPTSVSRKSLP